MRVIDVERAGNGKSRKSGFGNHITRQAARFTRLRRGAKQLRIMEEMQIAGVIVDAASKVGKRLGPGLLERVYEAVLGHELDKRGLAVNRQVPVPIVHQGEIITTGVEVSE